MIVKTHRLNSIHLFFVRQRTIVPAIIPKILVVALIGVFAKLLEDGILFGNGPDEIQFFSFVPFSALLVSASLFLGFYNNSSYHRWWEARILWGTQIIAIRNIIRFLLGSLGKEDEEEEEQTTKVKVGEHHQKAEMDDNDWRAQIILLVMAQTHALRSQLRPHSKMDEPVTAEQDRDRFLTGQQLKLISKSNNPANAILQHVGTIVGRVHRRGEIDTYSMIQLSKLIDELCIIQTGCERIHNTSIPLAYSLLLFRTTVLYCFLAPFAMVDFMGWWTPVFSAILAYTLFGLDELARQIQEPFNDEPHCLALTAMCRTIEIDVCEALNITPIPEKLKPIKSVLM